MNFHINSFKTTISSQLFVPLKKEQLTIASEEVTLGVFQLCQSEFTPDAISGPKTDLYRKLICHHPYLV
jgi:hypothetical protein